MWRCSKCQQWGTPATHECTEAAMPVDLEKLRKLQMSAKPMFDVKCYELARHFLPNGSESQLNRLAQDIQDAIEDSLRDLEEQNAARR